MKKYIFLLTIKFISAQFNYSGEINPYVMNRTSNKTQINLPYRIISLDLGYTIGNLDIKTVSKKTNMLFENYAYFHEHYTQFKIIFLQRWG